jgi:hypothetical protein
MTESVAKFMSRYAEIRRKFWPPQFAERNWDVVFEQKRMVVADELPKHAPAIHHIVEREPEPELPLGAEPTHPLAIARMKRRRLLAGVPVVPWNTRRVISRVLWDTGFSWADLAGPSRREPLVRARQELMYELSQRTALGLKRIGGLINRDHTTILHGVRKVEALHQRQDS